MSAPTVEQIVFPGPVAVAADHAGLALKQQLVLDLKTSAVPVVDLGTHTEDSVDYPDYAHALAAALARGDAACGVLICGTGIGMSIAANRHAHIRAALCQNGLAAHLTRAHNNANVLCLGARLIGIESARDALFSFLTTVYEGGRHNRRLEKLSPSGAGAV